MVAMCSALVVLGLSVAAGLLIGPNAAQGDESHPPAEVTAARTGRIRESGGEAALVDESEAGQEELVSSRTATSDTYALPDGEREARIYEAPVNFRDSEGKWAPIVEGFKRAGLGLGDRSHPVEIHLPSAMGNGPVRLGDAEHWISFELAGSESAPAELESGAVTYEAPDPGTSLEYTTLPNGVKETIELAGPSSPATINYLLSAASGIIPVLAEDGSIDFREKVGNIVAVMPPPTASEAKFSLAPEPGNVSYALTPHGNGVWNLAVEVDHSWLESPERNFPVLIDPTLMTAEIPSNSVCDLISGKSENAYYCNGTGGLQALWMDAAEEFNSSGRYFGRSVINFNLSAIPAGAEIKEATVKLYAPYETNVPGLELRRVLTSWDGSTTTWPCAYRDASGCHHWTTPGGDFNAEGSEILTSKRGPQAGWWSFTKGLAGVFEGWQQGNPNDGLLLRMKNEGSQCTAECLLWWRGELPTASEPEKRPFARVLYLPKAPATSQVTLPTEGTTTARRLRLKAKWGEEGSVGGVTFEYRTNTRGKGAFKPIPPELVYQANGEPIKEWPIHSPLFESGKFQTKTLYFDAAHAESKLQEGGGPIYIRAVFDGTAGVEGFTDPVEAVINRIIGSPHDATAPVGPGILDLETGNLSISHTDVSIPGFKSGLEFERTYNSRAPRPVTESEKAEPPGVLGPGWKTGISVEEAGGSEYRSVRMVVFSGELESEVGENCEAFEEEGKEVLKNCTSEFVKVPYRIAYAIVTSNDGGESWFEEAPGGTFVTPPELTGWKLQKNVEGYFVLSDTQGDVTTFKTVGGGEEYLPSSISQPGGAGNTTRLEWVFKNGEKQLKKEIATSAGLPCVNVTVTEGVGCHALEFAYAPVGTAGERLMSIKYLAPGILAEASEVAHYEYNSGGQLIGEWDPRISPPLKEQYAYEANGQLREVTPAGQKPWMLEYGTVDKEAGVGRLTKVKRASLLTSPTEAQTTIAYNVPISGGTAPYPMGGSDVGQWGQTDLPVEATAIFPPSEVPTANPPTSWAQATIYYLDSEGYAVNTATPKGGGTANPSISTAEPNEYGAIVRELTPDNRLTVLAEPEVKRKAKWEELETTRRYTEEGTQMVEELGPVHQIRIAESAKTEPARLKKVVEYDKGWPGTGVKPHLPTLVTTYADNAVGVLSDKKETETHYSWGLRKPTEVIVDPGTGHLNVTSVVAYNETTGLPIESRQPREQTSEGLAGKGAGTTKTIYFAVGSSENLTACVSTKYDGLPCRIEPAAQTEGTGRPKLLVKRFAGYNAMAEPTKLIESPGGSEVKAEERITTTTYDEAGRQLTTKIEGGGTSIPKTETVYSSTLGVPERQQFVCEGTECGTGGSGYQNFAYQSSFGSSGTGNGQFAHPAGIALDSSGNIWVVDESNNRLEKFNSNGEFLKAVGSYGSGNGQFNSPTDVAIDAAGNLFVTDAGNNRIEKLNPSGEFVSVFGSYGSGNGQFNGPESIAIANGHIWVGDTYNHRLQEFTEAGAFIKSVGSSGSGEGQMVEPTGIAIGPEEKVWVADWGNQRVEEFNESGSFVRQFGVEGAGNGQFNRPDVIEVDASGDVFVGDQKNERVQEFGQKGEFVGSFGTAGSGAGQFSFGWPMGLASDAKGDIWVADTGNNRVQKWTAPPAANHEATTIAYNALGQVTEYKDADGNKTENHYDIDGRIVTASDNKGTQTYHYDETSGLLTSLEDSGAGTFTATYDADGNLIERGLPNGLTAKTSYNAVDEPIRLTYTKGACEKECTWYEEALERSVYGQILTDGNSFAADRYKYDNAGRLKETQETPVGGQCTSREYEYDPDSNRRSQTVRPGVGSVCATSGGATQKYEYDAADRLMGAGLTYDAWGRIEKLPAEDAGGKILETKYFVDDTVASQTQGGVTNAYELDASLRQRQRIQAGGVAGIEIFHYDTPGDSSSWTALGSTWSRNIVGIGGELVASQESSGTVTFDLIDLHGDVVGTASSSPAATKLLATEHFDEFGERESGSAARFGWLGGRQRRTELASGVIQMGARSYIPQLGRFLTPDPMGKASANAYGYAEADPVNNFDLGGNCSENLCLAREYPPKPKKSKPSGGAPSNPSEGAPSDPRAEASTTNEPSPLNPSHSVHIEKSGCQFFETGRSGTNILGTIAVATVLYICNGTVSIAAYLEGPGVKGPTTSTESATGTGTFNAFAEWPGPPGVPLSLCMLVAYPQGKNNFFCQGIEWIFE